MELVVYTSPDPIHRLLMTDVIMADDRIERYFFGYKCKTCEEVYLVPDSVHSENDLLDWMRHVCDSCQITRTIRRARRMAGVEDQSTAFNPNLGRPSHYLGRPSQFFTGTRMQDPIMYDVRRSWKIVSGDDTEYEPY
jgi:hypothetical protein